MKIIKGRIREDTAAWLKAQAKKAKRPLAEILRRILEQAQKTGWTWKAVLFLGALALSIAPAQEPVAQLMTPGAIVKLAWADIQKIPPDQRPNLRYLSLHNLPMDERKSFLAVLSGHVNSLSSEPELNSLAVIDGVLVRLNLVDFGWKRAVWEKFSSLDSTFHVRIEIGSDLTWPGGIWPEDGKHYPRGSFTLAKEWAGSRFGVPAPWTQTTAEEKAAMDGLQLATGSNAPIVPAHWFLWQTATDEGRGGAGYYAWLGIKTQADYEKVARFSRELAAKLEHRRVVVHSGITQQPRRIESSKTVLSGFHETFDNVLAQDKHNPLRVLDNDFAHDVTEKFSALANGFPVWFLGDAKGKAQQKAPDNIVQGDHTGTRSKALLVNISCIRCHALEKHENFVKDIDPAPIGRIRAVEYEKLRELRRLYLRNIGPIIAQDRLGYAEAVKQATGMTVQAYAAEYGRWYAAYEDKKVGLAEVGLEFGMTALQVKTAFAAYDKTTDNLDPLLTIVMNGGTIGIRQLEEAMPLAWNALQGVRK